MTEERWFERPVARTAAVLALLAYLPALSAAPGRMPSDSKLYLYLDPGRFFGDAASTFDGRQFAGWVPHQHVAYLWPSTPWFWMFETLGIPDWIAHRLWIGTIMLAAGLGVRWCARLLALGPMAAFVAAVVYQVSVYVLPYVSRTSVMLLPWAGLGWIVAFTIRATRRRTWADPAAIALIVLTVGAVNATALAMIVPAPLLWLVHASWSGSIEWRQAAVVAARTGVLALGVSLWWIAMLVIQGRYGVDVLPYSESLGDVSLTATAPETWRGLGYWLFYVRDPYAATTTESLRYLSSTWSIGVSFLIPLLALAALTWVRWAHRRFSALLIGIGLILAVGVHPIDGRSPLMSLLAGDDESGLALALRSSTRALPVTMLGVALALAMATEAARGRRVSRLRLPAGRVLGGLLALVALMNLPSLWTGAFVDPALERDQDPPAAWADAVAALDATGAGSRVLQLPGAEFGAYRWGYTVDQPLPGLTDKPLITRDLLPLGSAGAMDLLYALDDRVQDGVFEPASLTPVSQLLGVDTIWLTNDAAFDRFRTARPEVVRDAVAGAEGIGDVVPYGDAIVNRPDVPMTDEQAVGDPRVGAAVAPVELAPLERPGSIVRAADSTVIVSGSGDGLVDAAAAGLIDPNRTATRYSADSLGDERSEDVVAFVITDSNRDRARHWRSSQDTTGYTEPGGPDQDVLRPVASDARLELFDTTDPATQTIAVQRGPVRATATAYGEPFAYLPEHRPVMAVDGDRSTAWLVGEHGDPVGEVIRLTFVDPVDSIVLHQPTTPGDRKIVRVSVDDGERDDGTPAGTFELTAASWDGSGQRVDLGEPVTVLDLMIESVAGGTPFTGSAVAAVGFTEIETGLGRTTEVVRPPTDAIGAIDDETPVGVVLTRLRTDPMDRWRDDPEPSLVREIEVPGDRTFDVELTVRIDRRAPDAELARLFGWPVSASTRLAGSPRHAAVAAFDDDPDTSWITAFGEARAATISATSAEPLETVVVEQPVSGFSRITGLTVRAGDEERSVQLAPDASGVARVAIDPPLPAGPIEFVLSEIDEVTTVDRRFGDPVTLPASVNELRFDGRPLTEPVGATGVAVPCTPIADVGGQIVSASIDVVGDGWLDGEPVTSTPCGSEVRLDGGPHLVEGVAPELPITLDRVVLDHGVRATLDRLDDGPTADVIADGRLDRSIRVSGCDGGCWLVLGEGHNDAWSARGSGGDLGPPKLIDGGFNGWWIEPTDEPVVIDVRWTAQGALNWALLLSAVATAMSIALIARERLARSRPETVATLDVAPPRWVWGSGNPATTRHVLIETTVWAVLAGLLIGPEWALVGLLCGLGAVALRHRRTMELTALASLLVVAVVVAVRERRVAPPPNGGWPGTFESLHGLGMFAIVCVLVAAIVADDGSPDGDAIDGTAIEE